MWLIRVVQMQVTRFWINMTSSCKQMKVTRRKYTLTSVCWLIYLLILCPVHHVSHPHYTLLVRSNFARKYSPPWHWNSLGEFPFRPNSTRMQRSSLGRASCISILQVEDIFLWDKFVIQFVFICSIDLLRQKQSTENIWAEGTTFHFN